MQRIIQGILTLFQFTPIRTVRSSTKRQTFIANVPSRRIQTCIHRYRTRRRLDPELSVYFNEYMFIGGVDTTVAAFNADELEDGSLIPAADAHARSPAHDDEAANARFYDGNARNWTVDFAGVAAGFLSVTILPLTCLEPAPTDKAIGLVENFLRYVLQHDVCPEYGEDINAALAVCGQAREEWPKLCRFKNLLPGQFNLAAAKTFGVHEKADWSLQNCKEPATLSPELIFYASLVVVEQAVPKTDTGESALRVTRQFTCSLALQSMEMPSDATSNHFRRLALSPDQNLNLAPLGRAVFRRAIIDDGWVHQVAPEPLPADEDVVLYFEQDMLAEMTVGMKVTAVICELSSGFRFVKTLETVQPSFYTFLPQHLIKDYKPPRLNDRPARSIHDNAAVVQREGGQHAQEPDEE